MPSLVVLLATAAAAAAAVRGAMAATCYKSDGTESTRSLPCNVNTSGPSPCCSPSDFCLDNGLCLDAGLNNRFTQQGCTDPNWGAPCQRYCTGESELLSLWLCGSQNEQYCCGVGGTAEACCSNGSELMEIAVFKTMSRANGVTADANTVTDTVTDTMTLTVTTTEIPAEGVATDTTITLTVLSTVTTTETSTVGAAAGTMTVTTTETSTEGAAIETTTATVTETTTESETKTDTAINFITVTDRQATATTTVNGGPSCAPSADAAAATDSSPSPSLSPSLSPSAAYYKHTTIGVSAALSAFAIAASAAMFFVGRTWERSHARKAMFAATAASAASAGPPDASVPARTELSPQSPKPTTSSVVFAQPQQQPQQHYPAPAAGNGQLPYDGTQAPYNPAYAYELGDVPRGPEELGPP